MARNIDTVVRYTVPSLYIMVLAAAIYFALSASTFKNVLLIVVGGACISDVVCMYVDDDNLSALPNRIEERIEC